MALTPEKIDMDRKAMTLLMQRGVLDKSMTLERLVAVSAEISKLRRPGELAGWTFVSPHYVYTGDIADIAKGTIINR
jgi:hypothetical protein